MPDGLPVGFGMDSIPSVNLNAISKSVILYLIYGTNERNSQEIETNVDPEMRILSGLISL